MIYPKNFENKIGFSEIRTMLKGRCLSELGVEAIDRLAFLSDKNAISSLLRQTREFRHILETDDDFPSENYFDMRPALLRIGASGSYLDEQDLFALKNSLATTSEIVIFLNRMEDDKPLYPALKKLTEDITCFPTIIERIDNILNKFGKIKDNASPELKAIRDNLAYTKRSISISLHRILQKARDNGYVEKDVSPTFRDGRLVIPIAPALKRKIKGIVHDESASGKTVFIEPAEVVEANNRVRELEIEEKRAIIIILQEITGYIRPHSESLLQSYGFLGQIDAIRSKAIVANVMEAVEPDIEDDTIIDWVRAYHPLLQIFLKRTGRTMEPLDIALTSEKRILLISGPNAGGKSVCLKTIGLLQYMVQCGLSIPVKENSRVGLFEHIFLDIGDEQSLENDLSTYSSHLLNMKNMIKQSDADSLILIDEFGGGTEPKIGAAISQAVLARFIQNQSFAVITTHYQNLKEYASNSEGIVNGAMLYDRQQMQPLFQLQIGMPGSSFAVEIARKTGLPDDVIREASDIVGSDYIQSDKYIQDIIRDKRYWENKRAEIHQKEKRLEELINKYERNVQDIETDRKEIIRNAKEQADRLLRESNAQIENTIRDIREAQAEKEETKRIRKNFDKFKENVLSENTGATDDAIARTMQLLIERKNRQEKRKKNKQQNTNTSLEAKTSKNNSKWSIGQSVKVKGQNFVAKIIKLNGSNAVIQSGVMQLSINTNRLIPNDNPEEKKTVKVTFIGKETQQQIREKQMQFHSEIDVRGFNGEEAINAVTHFVDDAILLGISPLRILHGTGSGYLRTTIRQYLHTIPAVTSYHDERIQLGGAGITIVELS